jgi:H+/gluconate symporter-like permease
MKLKVTKLMKNALLVLLVLGVLLGLGVLVVNNGNVKMASIANDIKRDHSRFTPSESVDVAMAMKLVTHEAPRMLNPPKEPNVLLLFPPSAEELARLTGE